MRYLKILPFFAMSFLVLLPSNGEAQAAKQTPENAHRFLTAIMDLRNIRIVADNDTIIVLSWFQSPTNSRKEYQEPPRWFPKLQSSEACLTKFETGNWPEVRIVERSGPNDGTPSSEITSNLYVQNRISLSKNGLNWKRVADVSRNGSVIIVGGDTLAGSVKFVFPSDDLATRAEFAMQVIKQSCDAAADTGF